MKILYNKGNLLIMENDKDIQCFSYNTVVATYNKLNNTYTVMDTYISDGEVLKMSRTSRKHQNIFKREYIPKNAQQV